jgi:hypothetical protein
MRIRYTSLKEECSDSRLGTVSAIVGGLVERTLCVPSWKADVWPVHYSLVFICTVNDAQRSIWYNFAAIWPTPNVPAVSNALQEWLFCLSSEFPPESKPQMQWSKKWPRNHPGSQLHLSGFPVLQWDTW